MNKIRVVLLDDEPAVIELLRLYMDKLKVMEIVGEYEDPIAFLKEDPAFDLLITDVDMPGMNGLELIKLVKKPILLVTGKANTYGNELLEASMAGGNVIGAIPKPINFDFLEKAVKKVIPSTESRPYPDFVNFKTRSGMAPIRLEKIQCIATIDFSKGIREDGRKAAKGNKWLYKTDGGQVEILDYTIEKIIRDLPPNHFCQISDSEIINRSAITVFTKNDVRVRIRIRTADGKEVEREEEIGIGDSFKSRFRDFMNS